MYDEIKESIDQIVAKYKELRTDGLSLADVFTLLVMACGEIVEVTATLNAPGADKKAAAMKAVETFIDTVVTPFDIPRVPNFAEGFVDQGIKAALMYFADAAIEAFVKRLPATPAPQPTGAAA